MIDCSKTVQKEVPHGKILAAEMPRVPAVLHINADKPGIHNCRAGDGTGGRIEIGGNMDSANFYSRYIAGSLKHGTPPKLYGQLLKTSRRKRKVRKRNV